MNETISLLKQHRTYRQFDADYIIPKNEIEQIIQATQQASTWMNAQFYSIISITDHELRQKITALQPFNQQIETSSLYLIFVGDLYKASLASQAYDGNMSGIDSIDNLINISTDAALAAQNTIIAAESLGYGVCVTGSIRSIASDLVELLDLPKYTFPLFGICIGKPDIEMQIKPRLACDAVYFENQYNHDLAPKLAEYEKIMTKFAEKREKFPWREKLSRYFNSPVLAQNVELLKKQGLLK